MALKCGNCKYNLSTPQQVTSLITKAGADITAFLTACSGAGIAVSGLAGASSPNSRIFDEIAAAFLNGGGASRFCTEYKYLS